MSYSPGNFWKTKMSIWAAKVRRPRPHKRLNFGWISWPLDGNGNGDCKMTKATHAHTLWLFFFNFYYFDSIRKCLIPLIHMRNMSGCVMMMTLLAVPRPASFCAVAAINVIIGPGIRNPKIKTEPKLSDQCRSSLSFVNICHFASPVATTRSAFLCRNNFSFKSHCCDICFICQRFISHQRTCPDAPWHSICVHINEFVPNLCSFNDT